MLAGSVEPVLLKDHAGKWKRLSKIRFAECGVLCSFAQHQPGNMVWNLGYKGHVFYMTMHRGRIRRNSWTRMPRSLSSCTAVSETPSMAKTGRRPSFSIHRTREARKHRCPLCSTFFDERLDCRGSVSYLVEFPTNPKKGVLISRLARTM